jgi:hypothetical protein
MSNGKKKNEDSWFSGWGEVLVGVGAAVAVGVAVAGAVYIAERTQEGTRLICLITFIQNNMTFFRITTFIRNKRAVVFSKISLNLT